ncbi:MAG: phosphate ABC transporter permease PstA [Planctomycetota bacterium]|nr:phosphate ABC transporter permease PstA [Planctomycetota bacterium]
MISARISQKIAFAVLLVFTIIVLVPVIAILGVLVKNGISSISWEFLSEMPRQGMRAGGIFPAIVGTLLLVVGTVLVALPVGVCAAIYLSEYAPKNRLSRIVRLSIVNLAGVPSIVHGLFGLGLFVLFFGFGTSLLAGWLTLAVLILPVIITAAEESLRAVPVELREASYALGATKWQTVRKVVLPSALPGIITGAILGIGRAAGETAPILFTVAAFYLPHLPGSIFDQVMALPYHLYVIATQVPNVPKELQYGTALVLMTLVFGVNLVAIVIRYFYLRTFRW